MIDLVHVRHVVVTTIMISYSWIHGYDKSVEGLPEGLILDIHDDVSNTVIQIEIRNMAW